MKACIFLIFAFFIFSGCSGKVKKTGSIKEFKGFKIEYIDKDEVAGEDETILYTSWGKEVPIWIQRMNEFKQANPAFKLIVKVNTVASENLANIGEKSNRADALSEFQSNLTTMIKDVFSKSFEGSKLEKGNQEKIKNNITTITEGIVADFEVFDSGYLKIKNNDSEEIAFKCFILMGMSYDNFQKQYKSALEKVSADKEFVNRSMEALDEQFKKNL